MFCNGRSQSSSYNNKNNGDLKHAITTRKGAQGAEEKAKMNDQKEVFVNIDECFFLIYFMKLL